VQRFGRDRQRCLTLPSSGPAYGRPLKSNVRLRTKPDHGSRSAARYAARAPAQNNGCRRRVEFGGSFEGCSRGRRELSVLRRPAHGCISSKARRSSASVQAPIALNRNTELRIGFITSTARGLALSSRAVQLSGRSCSLRIQRWYASPSKCNASLPPRERGLTLPSSGPAYGGPLKSNVRRHRTLSCACIRFARLRCQIQGRRFHVQPRDGRVERHRAF